MKIGTGFTLLLLAALTAGINSTASFAQISSAPTQYGARHAYQTASYSESMRRRYAPVASRYVQYINYTRGHRTSLERAIEAGRAAEGTRRAYYTRHRGTGYDGGTRRAYSS